MKGGWVEVWHPESPGLRVAVYRPWWKRKMRPSATHREIAARVVADGPVHGSLGAARPGLRRNPRRCAVSARGCRWLAWLMVFSVAAGIFAGFAAGVLGIPVGILWELVGRVAGVVAAVAFADRMVER